MRALQWSAAALLSLSLPFSLAQGASSGDASLEARAKQIHQRVLTFDSHVDVVLPSTPPRYLAKDGRPAAELSKLKSGGVDALALAIAVGPGPRTPAGDAEARKEANERLRVIQAFVKDNANDVALALSANDVQRIHREGKTVVIESFLNARSLGGKLDAIDEFYKQGVRIFGFTHAGNNAFADSSRPSGEPAIEHHGLSALGKQAVPRLNQLGVIIDISQLTPEGVFQVLELSRSPVIASHSAARALVNNTRNLSDRELDAIKKNGGVVHVTPFNPYVVKLPADFAAKVSVLRAQYGLSPDFVASSASYNQGYDTLPKDRQDKFLDSLGTLVPRATVSDYVDHIDYIAARIGVDHVGIGSDFNHGSGVNGFSDASEALNVTRELVRRGYTEEQIGKIWSGNFLRVFRKVEEVAGKTQGG